MKKKTKYPEKTVYYESLSCDFDGGSYEEKPLSPNFKYVKKSFFGRLASAFLYRCFATPVAFIYSKLVLGEKIIGKEKLKPYRNGCCFLYGNHTQPTADAFCPNIISFPERNYIIISRKNLSLPILGPMTNYLGGLPLPQDLKSAKEFSSAIRKRADEGAFITVYPEAHLWNYCSFLRPFIEDSFSYPVRLGKPVFSFTRVYKRSKRGVRSYVYIDGPFFPDDSLGVAQRKKALCKEVREAMEKRLKVSDVEVIKYLRKEETPKEEDLCHNTSHGDLNNAES